MSCKNTRLVSIRARATWLSSVWIQAVCGWCSSNLWKKHKKSKWCGPPMARWPWFKAPHCMMRLDTPITDKTLCNISTHLPIICAECIVLTGRFTTCSGVPTAILSLWFRALCPPLPYCTERTAVLFMNSASSTKTRSAIRPFPALWCWVGLGICRATWNSGTFHRWKWWGQLNALPLWVMTGHRTAVSY